MCKGIFFLSVFLVLLFSCSPQKDPWNETEYLKLQETYNLEFKKEILQAARESIYNVWETRQWPNMPEPGPNEGIAIRFLVNGRDRGCLAWYRNSGDIKLFAAFCAAEALRDPRYAPLRPEETADTVLELTIFGRWEEIADPTDFVLGFHNLWLIDGFNNTILQAAVAPQGDYSKEEFLEIICQKAALDNNAWKEDTTLKWRRSAGLCYTEPL